MDSPAAMEEGQGQDGTCLIAVIPPELLHRIVELAVDGLSPTIRLRSFTLRNLALVASAWTEPAQTLLESKVHIDSYHRARAYLDRPRRLARPLVLDELVFFFDFQPNDDDFFPLTEFMTRLICEMDCQIRALHLRSALFVNLFDPKLLLLPSFQELRHLKLDIPLEAAPDLPRLPLKLSKLSLSAMVDQPLALFKALLPSSAESLTSLHLFVIKSGSPLHEYVLHALPSLLSTLLHLSISTHWIPLPNTLVDFVLSCTSLRTLVLNGLVPKQLHELASRLSSLPLALEFTVPATFAWHGFTVESFVDRILRETSLKRLRFLTATRRIESGSEEKEQRSESRRGTQECACVYEVTTRRPLP
ncbi:hypothetical protein JCM10295v2_002878 [Rhodotorula toruloides]